MKKFLKVTCLAMGAVMALGLAACGDGNGTENGGGGGGNGGSISVHYFAGGFGKEVNAKLAADYKAITGVNVKYVASYSNGEIQSLLNSDQEKNDIIMPLLNIYQAQDAHRLEDLSSVYESIPTGETVAIKDKMNKNLYDYIEASDGKRYQMFSQNSVSALCYNADTLDAAYGKGSWTLPATTNEMFAMAEQLKVKGYYSFSLCAGINYYWDYLGVVWWAQYDGKESFENYYYGKYYDEAASDWKVGAKINDSEGRKVALNTMSRALKKANGYVHQKAEYMDFENAQAAFLGNGYVDDMKKCAFMVNGDWLENEMSSWLMQNPQNIGMMRAPVVSELTNKLSTVNSDAQLAEVVRAVDEGKTSVDGVSEADFNTVKTARLMGYTATPNYPIAIPANRPENKKKLAKDYLTYLYSDRAQKIIASELQGLYYPCSYVPDESVTVSAFVASRHEAFGNDFVPIFPINASTMAYRNGLNDLYGVSNADKQLYNGTSAESILQTTKTQLENNWNALIKNVYD